MSIGTWYLAFLVISSQYDRVLLTESATPADDHSMNITIGLETGEASSARPIAFNKTEAEVHGNLNESLTFSCTLRYELAPTNKQLIFYWSAEELSHNTYSKTDIHTVDLSKFNNGTLNTTLKISKLDSVMNNRRIGCRARIEGKTVEHTLKIVVDDKFPLLTSNASDTVTSLRAGDELKWTILVSQSSTPDLNYTWYKDEKKLTGERYDVKINNGISPSERTLIFAIKEVIAADAGVYRFELKIGSESKSLRFTLKVEDGEPEITSTPSPSTPTNTTGSSGKNKSSSGTQMRSGWFVLMLVTVFLRSDMFGSAIEYLRS